MRLNKRGDRTGLSPKPKGADNTCSKKWDVYKDGKFMKTCYGLRETGEFIGKRPDYTWQIANGQISGKKKSNPVTTKDGWTVLRHGMMWGYWLRQDDQQ